MEPTTTAPATPSPAAPSSTDATDQDAPALVDEHGNRIWNGPDGRRHRIGAPAVVKRDGDLEWWHHGKRHRTDGAAIEYNNGLRTWLVNGYLISAAEEVHLDALYDAGETLVLEGVLGAWSPSGPMVHELIEAVRAALLPHVGADRH